MSRDLIFHPTCSSKYITTRKNIQHFYMPKHPIKYYYHPLAVLLLVLLLLTIITILIIIIIIIIQANLHVPKCGDLVVAHGGGRLQESNRSGSLLRRSPDTSPLW